MELREVTYLAIALRITIAIIIGGILGLERGLKNRPAGLRTYMLVCVGACLIMVTNQYIYQVSGVGDPVRLGAQVISGIGFLGAGTIIVTRHNQIKGLTTAAGLWSAAAVGLALGIGFYEAAIFGSLAIFMVLTVLQSMDNKMHSKTKRLEVYVELDMSLTLGDFLRQVREQEIEISGVQKESGTDKETGTRSYIATLKTKRRFTHEDIIDEVCKIDGVVFLEEL